MNVLKSLFPLVTVAGMLLASPGNAKACDAFFPTGQAFAFSNGGFVYGPQAFFAPSYGFGFQQRAFFTPSYGFRAQAFVPARTAVVASPSIRVVNEQRGLFGRVRSRQVVQVN